MVQKRQKRAERGEEGWANWMSEAQSCGLHLSFASARMPPPYLSISRFISIFPPAEARRRASANPPPRTRNLSLDLAVAPVRLDVGRILREFSSLFEPPWNSIHVSGGRAKNPTTVADPLLAGAYVPSYVRVSSSPDLCVSTIAIRGIPFQRCENRESKQKPDAGRLIKPNARALRNLLRNSLLR